MIIKTISETSYHGMYKITATEGPAFFIRKEYLPNINFDILDIGTEFSEEQSDEILDAGLACVVELKAIEYLARAEQSRFGLSKKLLSKQYEKKYIEMALSFLESINYLSDERYARAWLNSRKINHYEGRSRLLAELQSRGISKDISLNAVNDFFDENDEIEICKKAYNRFFTNGKQGDKLVAALIQAGFSYKLIKNVSEINEV